MDEPIVDKGPNMFFYVVGRDLLAGHYEKFAGPIDDFGMQKSLTSSIRERDAKHRSNYHIYVVCGRTLREADDAYYLLQKEGPEALDDDRLKCFDWNMARQTMEDGHGGDADVTYRFMALPHTANSQKLMILAARVQRGEIGGPDDGGELDTSGPLNGKRVTLRDLGLLERGEE